LEIDMKIKKVSLLLSLGLMVSLFLLTTQAFAVQPGFVDAKKTPGTPPGKPTGGPDKSHGKPQNYKGIIADFSDISLALTLDDGTPVNFTINDETRIKAPGLHGEATGAVLQKGQHAMVQAVPDEAGNLVARSIMIIPGKPALTHRVGWVTELTEDSITILAHDGLLYTFTLTDETKILPAERAGELAIDSRVTIISPRDPASLGWIAMGIVVHPKGSGEGSAPPTGTPTP